MSGRPQHVVLLGFREERYSRFYIKTSPLLFDFDVYILCITCDCQGVVVITINLIFNFSMYCVERIKWLVVANFDGVEIYFPAPNAVCLFFVQLLLRFIE